MTAFLPVLGAALGLGCGILFAFAIRRQSIKAGIAAIIASFSLVSGALIAVRRLVPQAIMPFGMLSALALLFVVVIAALGSRDRP